MKKTLSLLATLFLLNGCAESLALLGTTASGASSGKITQSTFSSALSYGVKHQTGKSPSQHALTYVKKNNPEKKKDTCINFIKKTNSKMCVMVKKKISLTKAKIINIKKNDKSLKELSLSSQSIIDKKSKIKYLD
mgnify:FL=1|tara:strand:+ start:1093 stop:1497 length:405 start_codon:yes stop_codon:yes gene_type:complete